MEQDYENDRSSSNSKGADSVEGSQQPSKMDVNEKHKIIEIRKKSEVDQMRCRVDRMDANMHQFGKCFVEFQDNLFQNLAHEYQRLTQQMEDQHDRLARQMEDQKMQLRICVTTVVHEALLDTRDDIMKELRAECAERLKDVISERETGSTECKHDSEMQVKLARLIHEARKDIASIDVDLRAHTSNTERRLAALETDIKAHQSEVKDCPLETRGTCRGLDEMDWEEKRHSVIRLSLDSRMELQALREAAQEDVFPASSPRPKLQEKIGELDKVLNSLTSLVSRAGSREPSPTASPEVPMSYLPMWSGTCTAMSKGGPAYLNGRGSLKAPTPEQCATNLGGVRLGPSPERDLQFPGQGALKAPVGMTESEHPRKQPGRVQFSPNAQSS